MLYQLSYSRTWWMEKDSNLRRRTPTGLQPVPFGHLGIHPQAKQRSQKKLELAMGLEPATC